VRRWPEAESPEFQAACACIAARKRRSRFRTEAEFNAFLNAQLQTVPKSALDILFAMLAIEQARELVSIWFWDERKKTPRGNDPAGLSARRNMRSAVKLLIFSDAALNFARALNERYTIETAARCVRSMAIWLLHVWPLTDGAMGHPVALADFWRLQVRHNREIGERILESERSHGASVSRLKEVEAQLCSELSTSSLLPPDLIGKRGGARGDVNGIWRGWVIRTTALMVTEDVEDRYATISGLLTAAGIGGVSPQLVRSILLRGRT
jgi:hypothetical protein